MLIPVNRYGFSYIYSGREALRRLCRAAGSHDLSIGVIFNLQNHNLLPGVSEHLDLQAPRDLWLHQWRLDGQH